MVVCYSCIVVESCVFCILRAIRDFFTEPLNISFSPAPPFFFFALPCLRVSGGELEEFRRESGAEGRRGYGYGYGYVDVYWGRWVDG